MKLKFDKSGRRFFFLTFCVRGRRSVLSRLISGNGMIPVCGFLSPGEKELERRLREKSDTRWIKTVAHGLPPRFDPTVEDSRFLSEGRQLVLSSFALDVPVFPVNYDNCHLMNARNEELCARANGETGPCDVPGSGEARSMSII